MSTVDWNSVRQRAKAAADIPPANYELVLDNAEGGETSKGAPSLKLRFKVTSGPYAEATVFGNMSLQMEYPGLVHQFLADLEGLGINTASNPGDMNQIAAALMQAQPIVTADVENNTYNGRVSNRIKGGTIRRKGQPPASSGAPASASASSAPALPPMPDLPPLPDLPPVPVENIPQMPSEDTPPTALNSPSPFAVAAPTAEEVPADSVPF